jgi:hypothetical protein
MFVEKIYIKWNIWKVAVCPSYVEDAQFLKVKYPRFKLGQSHQDFSGRKNPQYAFFRRGSKAVSHMSQIFST